MVPFYYYKLKICACNIYSKLKEAEAVIDVQRNEITKLQGEMSSLKNSSAGNLE